MKIDMFITNQESIFRARVRVFARADMGQVGPVRLFRRLIRRSVSFKYVLPFPQAFSTPLSQLQQRTWLLHWSLFVFFNHENGNNLLIDMFFQEK